MFNKIINICAFFIVLILIVVTGYKFAYQEISIMDLVIIEFILVVSLFALFFMVLDKVSALNQIINKQPKKVGDIALNLWGFFIGLAGIYIFLFWKYAKTTKIIILTSSLFFIVGFMCNLLISLCGIERKKRK